MLRTGLGGWSQADIATFLKTGHNDKGVAFGSMLDVVNNSTPYLTDDDINAIAAYLKSLPPTRADKPPSSTTIRRRRRCMQRQARSSRAATLYPAIASRATAPTARARRRYMPPLAGNPVVLDKDPSSLINSC